MKKRNDVETKYTWDLSVLYSTHEEYQKDFDKVKELSEKVLSFRGKLLSKDEILKEFKISSELSRILEKMEVWLMLRKETDGTDKNALEDIAVLDNFLTDYSEKSSFIDVELSALDDDFIDEMINDPRFVEFDRGLLYLKEDKKHVLDEEREKMLSQIGSFANFGEIFSKLDDIELKFGKITLGDGTEVEVTNDNYNLYIHDTDQCVRRQVFEVLHKGFKDFNLTISENFMSFLKYCDVVANFRKFDGCFDSRMSGSRINGNVVKDLIRNVNENLKYFFKYAKLLKNCLGLDTMTNADVYAPVIKSGPQKIYTFDEACEIVKDALAPMGREYLKVVNTLIGSRTIDVYPTENKGGGGFSTGCFDSLPFILLNFNGTHNDVSTLAHEMGHSMHTYLSNKNQCFEKSGYDIFVAEIASTVNEILLFHYMEKQAKSVEERKSYVANFLSTFYSTVFRQTMFTEFELFAHTATKQRKPLTFEKLNEAYGDLQKKYFGDDIVLLENANVEWSRIPHFYRPFYVFKYATGFISACSIVSNILNQGEEYVKNYYLKFLSAGGAMDPLDILKLANVDISDPETYRKAFELYDHYINVFEVLK